MGYDVTLKNRLFFYFMLMSAGIITAEKVSSAVPEATIADTNQQIKTPSATLVQKPNRRSREEVQALIEHAGKTKPDWWDSVSLSYPDTLDLNYPNPANRKWNPKKNVGQYMWGIINENAKRFRQGTKFMHYVYSLNKDDPEVTRRTTQQLGHCYHDLLQDWARAAYWLRKANNRGVKLANAYWQLGSKEMAEEILRPIKSDYTKHGAIIKLWSDMGELETALKLANRSQDPRNRGGLSRAAGDALQRHGRFDEALVYYQKVLDIGGRYMPAFLNKNEVLKLNQNHAKAAIESIRIFAMFDVSRLRDGSFTDSALGYSGAVQVNTTVKSHRIESVKVIKHKEQQYYSSLIDTPEQILRKQDIRNIDATTGATVTADAIRIATAKALQQARE